MNVAKRSPHRGPHRVYLNKNGGELVRCEHLSNEALARMAEETSGIVVREVGANWPATSEVDRVKSLVEALQWRNRHLMSDPGLFRRLMVRQLGERRMRLNRRTSRIFLGGAVTRVVGEDTQRILLLVVVPRSVHSCDVQI